MNVTDDQIRQAICCPSGCKSPRNCDRHQRDIRKAARAVAALFGGTNHESPPEPQTYHFWGITGEASPGPMLHCPWEASQWMADNGWRLENPRAGKAE